MTFIVCRLPINEPEEFEIAIDNEVRTYIIARSNNGIGETAIT